MNILTKIKNSIYNPEYYKSLPLSESLGSGIKYLVKLSLLVSLLSVIIFAFYIPDIYHNVKDTISSTVANYPNDLVVSIKNGTASVNKPEPYMMPISNAPLPANSVKNFPSNIIVIDTTKPFSSPQFETYSSIAWLTKTELVVIKDTSGQVQILPLAKFPNVEITKSWVQQKETFILKILPWMFFAFVLLFYVMLFAINFVGTLGILFLYAFIIWLMAKIKKVELSYKNSYKIGIHAMTLLMILGVLDTLLKLPDNFFIKLVILIIVVYFNFFKDSKEEVSKLNRTN